MLKLRTAGEWFRQGWATARGTRSSGERKSDACRWAGAFYFSEPNSTI